CPAHGGSASALLCRYLGREFRIEVVFELRDALRFLFAARAVDRFAQLEFSHSGSPSVAAIGCSDASRGTHVITRMRRGAISSQTSTWVAECVSKHCLSAIHIRSALSSRKTRMAVSGSIPQRATTCSRCGSARSV